MTSASSWASAARGWISSTTSEPCVEARRRRLASGPLAYPCCGCATGVPGGCATGVPGGCATGVPGAVGPARPLAVGPARPLAVGPARPLAVRAASFARRVGSKPGQALRPRRRSPHWWRVVCGARPGPPHLRPSRLFITDPPTNFACNSPVTISNHEFTVLELQRFQALLNVCPIELHATLVGEQASLPADSLHTGGAWCVPGQALRPRRRPLPGLIRIGCAHVDRLCTSG